MKSKLLVLLWLLPIYSWANEVLVIAQEKSLLRSTPSLLAAPKGELKYGAKVTVIEKKGSWLSVKHNNLAGWIHSSSLGRAEKLNRDFKQSGNTKGIYQDEVAAAGKGFSPEYEAAYKKDNPELRFDAVDEFEKFSVSENELKKFMTEGGLATQEVKP
jgi:uncharacterized protein YgiM (DUF1202 family)